MKYKKQAKSFLLEIITIIIGVIIAFYLTEYGKQIDRRQDEKDITSQIYFELKDNLVDLERDLRVHQTGLLSNLRVIKFLNEDQAVTDSLIMDFYWMTRDEYVFANSSGYENLKAFGVSLVRDDSLRNLITLVYNHDFPRLFKGNTIYPDINEYLTPFFKQHFSVNQDTARRYTLKLDDSTQITYPREIAMGVYQMVGYIPLNADQLRKNEEFRFLVSKALEFRMYKFFFYRSCIENVKKAIQRIEALRGVDGR